MGIINFSCARRYLRVIPAANRRLCHFSGTVAPVAKSSRFCPDHVILARIFNSGNRMRKFVLVVGLIVCSAVSAATTTTSTAPAKGFTQRDYRAALLEFNRRTLTDAYKQIGQRDPKWDDDAL